MRLLWQRRHVWRLRRKKNRRKKIYFFCSPFIMLHAAHVSPLQWNSCANGKVEQAATATTATWPYSSSNRSQSRKRNSKITAMRQMKRLWKKTTKRKRRNRPTNNESQSVSEREREPLRKRKRKRTQIKVRGPRAKSDAVWNTIDNKYAERARVTKRIDTKRNATQPDAKLCETVIAERESVWERNSFAAARTWNG